jgi:pyrroloquinoline quinone (PQQ) biosynthesis protein C
MAEVVYEEGTGRIFSDGVAHPELYLLMGEAFGISRADMFATEYCAGALCVRHYFENVCRRGFLEGFAALALGGEASGPGVLGKVSTAFQKHYGLTAQQTRFYSVHEEADSDHSSGGADFLRDFAKTDADVALVVASVRDSVEAMSGLWDDIWQRVQKLA